MKHLFYLISISYLLTGCSTFERKEPDNAPPFPPSEASMETIEAPASPNPTPSESNVENEVARLNSKIEALETKLNALSENIQISKDRSSQPRIQAEQYSDANLANSPAEKISQDVDPDQAQPLPKRVGSETAREQDPEIATTPDSPTKSGPIEAEFQSAMKQFHSGKYKESANHFFAIYKNNPHHILASHALYWAGEAGAHAHNWKIAISHWSALEANYPRSIYIPEALAGLATAYESAADPEKAKRYREVLQQSFPDAAAAVHLSAASDDSE